MEREHEVDRLLQDPVEPTEPTTEDVPAETEGIELETVVSETVTEGDEPNSEDTLSLDRCGELSEEISEELTEEISEEPTAEDDGEATDALLEVSSSAPSNTIILKKSHLAIGAVVLMALLVGAVLLGMSLNRGKDGIDPSAVPYTGAYSSTAPSADQIALPGYSDIVFPADRRDVQIVLPNPEGNSCYFVFSLVLNDNQEELYRSGLIPPGMAVTNIRLSRPLDVGVYDMRICIEPLSLDEQTPLNGGVYETVLTVKHE